MTASSKKLPLELDPADFASGDAKVFPFSFCFFICYLLRRFCSNSHSQARRVGWWRGRDRPEPENTGTSTPEPEPKLNNRNQASIIPSACQKNRFFRRFFVTKIWFIFGDDKFYVITRLFIQYNFEPQGRNFKFFSKVLLENWKLIIISSAKVFQDLGILVPVTVC